MQKNEKGQALVELIIFLPIMFMLYAVISGYANAINGSINQQKVTRAYFYFRAQNNSTIPKPDAGSDQPFVNWKKFGMFFIGWRERFEGKTPVLPCYKVSIPMQAAPGDVCEQEYTSTTTQYIRVGTVYGVCGASYWNNGSEVIHLPDDLTTNFFELTDYKSCTISR